MLVLAIPECFTINNKIKNWPSNTPIFIVLAYYTGNMFRRIVKSSSGPYGIPLHNIQRICIFYIGAWSKSKYVARIVRKYNKYWRARRSILDFIIDSKRFMKFLTFLATLMYITLILTLQVCASGLIHSFVTATNAYFTHKTVNLCYF